MVSPKVVIILSAWWKENDIFSGVQTQVVMFEDVINFLLTSKKFKKKHHKV